MSTTKRFTPASTFWVRAKVIGPLDNLTAKVSFGPGYTPECGLVGEAVPGWNFSNHETAEELAEYAANQLAIRLYAGLAGGYSVITEVVEEQ